MKNARIAITAGLLLGLTTTFALEMAAQEAPPTPPARPAVAPAPVPKTARPARPARAPRAQGDWDFELAPTPMIAPLPPLDDLEFQLKDAEMTLRDMKFDMEYASGLLDKLPRGVLAGVPGGVLGGIPGGIRGGIPGGVGLAPMALPPLPPMDVVLPAIAYAPGQGIGVGKGWGEGFSYSEKQKSDLSLTPEEEMKAMALNGLRNADPSQAVPVLDKFLKDNNTAKLKDRALSILAGFGTADARAIVSRIAHNDADPDMQLKALRYLGRFEGADTKKELVTIYTSTKSTDVKKTIIRILAGQEDVPGVMSLLRAEADTDMRMFSVRALGSMHARDELRELYNKEVGEQLRVEILRAMQAANDYPKIAEVAKMDADSPVEHTRQRRNRKTSGGFVCRRKRQDVEEGNSSRYGSGGLHPGTDRCGTYRIGFRTKALCGGSLVALEIQGSIGFPGGASEQVKPACM
ncbi:MAG: HEAT repeat domain-containing protein [Acidobacteria bacterium]|nr:HEAT repeat domain-containing protein [Acidobacteriota bacterium]